MASSWKNWIWLLWRRTLVPSLLVLWVTCLGTHGGEDEAFNAESWLRMYGYLPQASRQMSTMRSAHILSNAVSDMQRFYGLEVTGAMDQGTVTAMRRPRCGVPDKFGGQIKTNVRRKRYALTGHKWNKSHLTYSIQNYTPKIGEYNSYEAIRRAFKVWQKVTPLTFDEIPYQEIKYGRRKEPDIMIFFASGFHGDSSPLMARAGSLPTPTSLVLVWAVILTLILMSHGPSAMGTCKVMICSLLLYMSWAMPWAWNTPTTQWPLWLLSTSGWKRMTFNCPRMTSEEYNRSMVSQVISPNSPPNAPPRRPDKPRTTDRPDHYGPNICEGNFDTVTMLRGEMFVFKGRWFWRVRRNRVLDNYPMPIGHFWRGLPGDIDAAYERHDGKFVFFKGNKYWLFREANLEPGYPQELTDYGRDIPYDRIDTAIWWEPSGFTYFFKGDWYWRFNEQSRAVDKDYPKPISVWGSAVPSSPKGAFLSDDGAYTYFYKGSKYWKFDNHRMKSEPGYPKSILRDFMGCSVDLDPDRDRDTDAGRKVPDVDRPPFNPDAGRDKDKDKEKDKERDHTNDVDYKDERDEETNEVDVVLKIDESETRAMNIIMVTVPLILVLCILGLTYAIINTLKRKGAPKLLVHCKRSMQDWV
ncbi:hypothetical protein J4Q44_G00355620 [Coregonus suidteri]|uniref:Peptidase metallopeptidase domain-containing protein n=1 Tax=Coregonus suidteri TaxID=861788 RepID=A0AAN8KNV4_9TELE